MHLFKTKPHIENPISGFFASVGMQIRMIGTLAPSILRIMALALLKMVSRGFVTMIAWRFWMLNLAHRSL